jgi:hypothetical protein
MEILIVLGVIILVHGIIIARAGIGGVVATYVIGAIIWVFYPGYATGFSGLLITEIVVVSLMAFGSLFPSGAKGIAAAGIGGYLAGRWMGRL